MTSKNNPIPNPGQPWKRHQLVDLLGTGSAVREYSFVRKAVLGWLAVYPGDLPLQLLHARAFANTVSQEGALELLDKICQRDPHYLEAQQARFEISLEHSPDPGWSGEMFALSPNQRLFRDPELKALLPSWARTLARIRAALHKDDLPAANQLLPELLAADPDSPLAATTHLEVLLRDPGTPDLALRQLAEFYLEQHPQALIPGLVLADILIKAGQSSRGVDLIHAAAAEDITGRAPRQIWGSDHPYQKLWPGDLEAYLELQVPASVSGALGRNQLPAGKETEISQELEDFHSFSETRQSKSFPAPEKLIRIDDDLEFAGQKMRTRGGGKFPIYVVFSTRKGLADKFGPETASIIIEEMKKTTYAVRLKPGWGAVMVLADDPSSMANFGLKPTVADDPWALKLALSDLDRVLNSKGLLIGALLIVGGPDVVPYHRLPNPVADIDAEVPSDNPYATLDENYFVPEWPVGRLPGGAERDPGLLLDMLRHISEHHMGDSQDSRGVWERFLEWMLKLVSGRNGSSRSFAYVAEAWKSASQSVFKSLQEEGSLVTSPPFGKETEIPVPVTRYGYFNLHGVEDGPEWFGQKDFTNGSAGPDYPVALRPRDINAYEDAPLFVFSEACYGVHLKGRNIEDSIALKYLSRGSHAVVGSTVTAYGSVAAPLIAADLLADHYWRGINRGMPSGIALQRAKIELARVMNSRQGYLDGEDQKTLISFLHFGDPLASPRTAERVDKKTGDTPRHQPAEVKTVCDRSNLTTDIPSPTLMHVKQVVKRYLPGMEGAEMLLSTEKDVCSGDGHNCPTAHLGHKTVTENLGQRQVVTLHKQIESPQNGSKTIHRHYARMTFDPSGKMVKLAVSR